jgi:hypothetical protein
VTESGPPTRADRSPSPRARSRQYATHDLKLLWGLSAGRCAFPKCRTECFEHATAADGAVVLGKVAHIVAHSEKGPRGDPLLTSRDRDRYENLILLCGKHHDIVDGQCNTYTAGDLRVWKRDLEEWVRFRLAEEIEGIGFAEMEVVAKYIVSAPSKPEKSLRRISPEEKMKRNGLTDSIRILLDMGFAKAHEVSDFVQAVGMRDPKFPERLKAGLLTEYKRRFNRGERGDALFLGLLEYASGASRDMLRQAAGLAVLGYFFELCEVFER